MISQKPDWLFVFSYFSSVFVCLFVCFGPYNESQWGPILFCVFTKENVMQVWNDMRVSK